LFTTDGLCFQLLDDGLVTHCVPDRATRVLRRTSGLFEAESPLKRQAVDKELAQAPEEMFKRDSIGIAERPASQ